MRLASIDIGTNSVLLLVAECLENGRLLLLEEDCLISRLGQEVSRTGRLAPDAIERTLQAIALFSEKASRWGVKNRCALGTSALREARDSALFLGRAETLWGSTIEVISGAREAELVLAGVRGTWGSIGARTLLFDVGGGSTELIYHGDSTAKEILSLEIGAVRVTENFFSHDPPREEELLALRSFLSKELSALPAAFGPPSQVIGISGTVTALAMVQLGLLDYDTNRVNGLQLSKEQVTAQIARYAELSLAERKAIVGLEAARADIILAGAMIVDSILERFTIATFRVCDRGVRWGALFELCSFSSL
jgi:exopolyphosphatase / guanosine-5'-triphosphate,3'-diphosphate pyrophosphatase